jgi:DNA-directed RNA polymerase specialized sigma24 family protein
MVSHRSLLFAYLIGILTRQCLDRMRTLARQREEHLAEGLPEPPPSTPDVAEDVELPESVSIAMLTVPETVSPTERAGFVLREVFATPYDGIVAAPEKSAAATEQVARWARAHVKARRPRVHGVAQRRSGPAARHRRRSRHGRRRHRRGRSDRPDPMGCANRTG